MNFPSTFFGWVAFLLEKYGTVFLRGTGTTLLIALTGTVFGFIIGLLVAIARTIELRPRASRWRCASSPTPTTAATSTSAGRW